MPKIELADEQKIDEEISADPRKRMTLGEAADISSMTILRRQLEVEETEEEESSGEVK